MPARSLIFSVISYRSLMRLETMAGTAVGMVELGEGAATRGAGTSPGGNIQPQSSQKACLPLRGARQLGHSCGGATVSTGAAEASATGEGGGAGVAGIARGGDASATLTGIASGGETASSLSIPESQSGNSSSAPAPSRASALRSSLGASFFSSTGSA